MPSVTLRKKLYDALVRHDEDPNDVTNRAVRTYLQDEHGIEVEP